MKRGVPTTPGRSGESASGFLYTAAAFLIWGLSPVYWKQLASVPSLEIIMHRVVWSPLILLPVLFRQRRTGELVSSLKTTRTLLNLLVTTILVSGNWLIFIWAINNGHVLQTSIGYYITPLINVLLGMVFLKERLRPLQIAALALAAAAVLYLTVDYGSVPWIALALGFSFGLYGMLHKVMPVTPITGLTVEMLLLWLPATGYLVYADAVGAGAFLHAGAWIDMLLVATTLFTAFPLLLFNIGAKRLHLSTVGFLQYIAPSCYFLLAVFVFHEPVSRAQIWAFCMIWLALGCYSTDSVLYYRWVVGRFR